jgi:hypothetical protein
MDDKIRILFFAANPFDSSKLRLGEEAREIDNKIRSADFRDSFTLIPQLAVRAADLQGALLRHKPHIVHFSGHGNRTRGIVLENDRRKPVTVRKEVFGSLLRILNDQIRVVVLNSCYSKQQFASITDVIDYTVVMDEEIHDKSSIVFSAAFYRALAYGRTIKESFDLGVNEIGLLGVPGYNTPQVLIRSGVNPLLDSLITPKSETSSNSADMHRAKTIGATGTGNVAIGGSADGATIITGDIDARFGGKQ